ncbi:MAG: hypothetical protein K2M13_03100 [Muribaculaceae bacterium]|nr:hypothetical protein [Muribaculaceae bacterium]
MEATLQKLKKEFFAFRNGIVADTLRKHFPYKIVFGLQVPQLAQIAAHTDKSMALAERLWGERGNRESRLLATYLFPLDEVTPEMSLKLASEVETSEEADMLIFRVLKRLPFARFLLTEMENREDISDYLKDALRNHLS